MNYSVIRLDRIAHSHSFQPVAPTNHDVEFSIACVVLGMKMYDCVVIGEDIVE